jgi:hypothetical protein
MPLPSDRLQIIHQVSPVDYGQMPSTFSRHPTRTLMDERPLAGKAHPTHDDKGRRRRNRNGQAGSARDCQLMKLSDLAESARAQVAAGLPAGTLEQADAQLRRLSTESLLPLCPPAGASRRNHNRAPGRRSPSPSVNLR